jgi:hypothetical protein
MPRINPISLSRSTRRRHAGALSFTRGEAHVRDRRVLLQLLEDRAVDAIERRRGIDGRRATTS